MSANQSLQFPQSDYDRFQPESDRPHKSDNPTCLPQQTLYSNIQVNKRSVTPVLSEKQPMKSPKYQIGSTTQKTMSNDLAYTEGGREKSGQLANAISEFNTQNRQKTRHRTGRIVINYESMSKMYEICISELSSKTLQHIIEALDLEHQ